MDLSYYRETELDASILLNYPKGMTGVLSTVEQDLKAKGSCIVDEGAISIKRARELVASATGDKHTYYQITSDNPNVWSVLRDAVNEDRLRVVGIFHGRIPDSVPESVILVDVGAAMGRKVAKDASNELSQILGKKGAFPKLPPEKVYAAILALCYEVLFDPEYRVYKKSVADLVPKAEAFDFMYNPPSPMTGVAQRGAVVDFITKIHSYL